MSKEVRKGNKIPYHGYLLNMKEYHQYEAMQELIPEMIHYFNMVSEERRRERRCLK